MPQAHRSVTLHTFGLRIEEVSQRLGELRDVSRNPSVGTTQCDGIVSVLIRSRASGFDQAQALLDETIRQVERRLGLIVFGRDSQTLPQSVVELTSDKGLTLVTAESCTGGLIGKMITDVAGASGVYLGGWITYSDQMKHEQLGVPMQVIHQHGAVSGPVAAAMARGALTQSHADLSVAVTGIAGPGGATPDKPIGTVWVAVGARGQIRGQIRGDIRGRRDDEQAAPEPATLPLKLAGLHGDRTTIRDRAAKSALQCLRLAAMEQPLTALYALPEHDESQGSG